MQQFDQAARQGGDHLDFVFLLFRQPLDQGYGVDERHRGDTDFHGTFFTVASRSMLSTKITGPR